MWSNGKDCGVFILQIEVLYQFVHNNIACLFSTIFTLNPQSCPELTKILRYDHLMTIY